METPDAPKAPHVELPPAEPGALVTFVPELNRMEVSGVEQPYEHTWNARGGAEKQLDNLTELYLPLGEGTFTLSEVAGATKRRELQAISIQHHLRALLPAELFDYAYSKKTWTWGNFAIAVRQATEEELPTKILSPAELAKQEKELQIRDEVHEAEAHKADLTTYDHALITVDEKVYNLPLASPLSILAARTIQVLSRHSVEARNDNVDLRVKHLINEIWNDMPLNERRLFAKTELQLYRDGAPLAKDFNGVVSAVCRPLGLAKRGDLRKEITIRKVTEAKTVFYEEAPETPYADSVTHLVAPGSPRELVLNTPPSEVTEEERATVEAIVAVAKDYSLMSQRKALDCLDVLMDRRLRGILRHTLREEFGNEGPSFMDALNQRVERSLKSSYHPARRERMISGFRHGKGVQQVSGDLPGTTFDYMQSPTTRWHFRTLS